MSGSVPEKPQTSAPQSTASAPEPAPAAVGPGGSGEVSFGEQNLSFTTTDVSLVEMMEIEYTQLQRILYSHTEARASEGEAEARLSSFSLPGTSADTPLSGNQSVYPVTSQSGFPSDSNLLSSNPRLGCADFQELRMMLFSESNLSLSQTDKTLNNSSAEASGHRSSMPAENPAPAPEPRSKSAVRVRLEERFNNMQAENQEPQESGVTLNNLVTLMRQPSEPIGVPLHQQENKCAALGKNKTLPATPTLQFTCPLITVNACSTAGSANPSQTQTSGMPCTILEAAKHQDLGIPKTLSFCYQEIESTKQTVGAMNKALPEEGWIKVGEDTLCKQEMNRSCSHAGPLDPNTDRKPLGEIQNVRQSGSAAPGPWQPAQPRPSTQAQGGAQDGVTQRRERHNRMERDRRRRIRFCCDELNLLVPFCTVDTDKATTLEWTSAFLKYIQEQHGDSLKQEFETVFCGKTGRRLKPTGSESFVMHPVQENKHGFGDQVV
uniref:Transcription factor like 5 n=1 Tax=Otus sunia TaxID=257818 RepID=A0A8C8AXK3_9STRI